MTTTQASPPSPSQPLAATEASSTGVFAVVALAVFLATLDSFIVNIAVPSIQRAFHGATVADVSWVVNAYAIAFAALLVPAGKLGDVIGRRKVFMLGLLAFGLGSALCAAAPSLEFLVGARVLQGAGAAGVTPTSMGLLLPSLPPQRRPGAIGAWAAIGAIGAASGPPLGGLLTTELGWHWIFIVNVPLALIALLASSKVLPEIRDPERPPLPDGLGTILLVVAVTLATLGLIKGTDWNWDARVVGSFLAAALLTAQFVWRSARHPAPVLELSIVRVPAFALASLSAGLFFAAFGAMLLGQVYFLTDVWHYSALHAGVALTPGPVMAAIFARVSGRLAARYGPGVVGALGGLVFSVGAGLLWIILIGTEPDYAGEFLPGTIVGGAGVGLALPSFTIAATRTLPPQRLATGIGAQTMFRQIGATLGVAAFVAILGTPTTSDILTPFDNTRWFMIAAAAGAALALILIRRPAPAPAPTPVAPAAGDRLAPAAAHATSD